MPPLISIIIPAYNSEDTILRCVNSALNQSYANCEILIVNDGSTDKTANLVQEKYSDSNKVKLISQINSGVSSARNTGINEASGEFIFFLDSDDELPLDSIQLLYNAQRQSKAEMVVGRYSDGSESEKAIISGGHLFAGKSEMTDYLALNQSETGLCKIQPWGKLYVHKVIDENNIRFDETISLGEDTIFTIDYLHHIDSIQTVNSIVYFYYEREGSLSTSKSNTEKIIDARIRVFEKRMKLISAWNTLQTHPEVCDIAFSDITVFLKMIASDEKNSDVSVNDYLGRIYNNASYKEAIMYSQPDRRYYKILKNAYTKHHFYFKIIVELMRLLQTIGSKNI